MSGTDYPTAHMAAPQGVVTATAVDDGVVCIGYRMPDFWTLLTIYLTPEQARTLASQLVAAADQAESGEQP